MNDLHSYSTSEDIPICVNKHMERVKNFNSKGNTTKSTTEYHFPSILKIDNIKCCQECRFMRVLIRCWWKWKVILSFWRAIGQFLVNFIVYLPYDMAISALRGIKIYFLRRLINECYIPFIHRSPELQTTQIAINWRNNFWNTNTIMYSLETKIMNYCYMGQHAWTSKHCGEGKKPDPKRAHTLCLHLYKVQE